MKNITKRRIIVGILLVVGFSFLIKRCIKATEMNEKSSENSQYLYHQKFDKEDSILFKTNELKNLKSAFEIKSNFRFFHIVFFDSFDEFILSSSSPITYAPFSGAHS